MENYYGDDWRTLLRTGRAASRAERIAAGDEVRTLFPDVRATSVASGASAAPRCSTLLRRANTLLTDTGSYQAHYARIVRTCTLGSQISPDTFTPGFVRIAKAKVNILLKAYETIEEMQDDVPASRDHPDVGNHRGTVSRQIRARDRGRALLAGREGTLRGL